ncbi:MAG: META domain-containing protein, partial [Caldilineaceae bacterium]|nr:META domain-containing protein [Caldilineaceae bacterium]
MRSRSILATLFVALVSLMLAACIQPLEPNQDGTQAPSETAGETPATNMPDASGELTTLYVGPVMADCVGVAPQYCLFVKTDPDADYEYFYDQIDGFDYVPGYAYELSVQVTERENVPADASSLQYTLVDVVSSELVGPTLEEMDWQLTAQIDDARNRVAPLSQTTVTARFEADQVTGNNSCNTYFAPYTLDGTNLTIDAGGSTMMACIPEVMEQEQSYMAALSAVGSYLIVGDELRLLNQDGRESLIYTPQESGGLTGTTWSATFVNNGKEAVVSLAQGTEITAIFGEDGTLSGSAGCNNYSSSYTVDGDAIAIGPSASTRMMCAEPEGVMDQETSYLMALENAATYRLKGDRLELRAADGALQVEYAVQGQEDAAVDMPTVDAPAAPDAAEDANTADADTTLTDTLGNLEYTNIAAVDGPVQMVDGTYEGEPFVEGGAARPIAQVTDIMATGEISGTPSAAVLVYSSAGGSGGFLDLAVVQEVDGVATNVATTFLGDRVDVREIAIAENQVVIDMVTQGPNDPMCCPTQRVVNTYALGADGLVQSSSTVIGFESAATKEGADVATVDLIGQTWEWVEFQGGDDSVITVDNPTDYTLLLNPDASAVVEADCNVGSGTYNLTGNSLTINIMLMTMAACPPDSLSDQYLQLLSNVVTYVVDGDTLVLNLMADAGNMYFVPLASTPDTNEEAGVDAIKAALANTTYNNLAAMDSPVQLVDGQFEGEPFVEGGAARPIAQLTDFVAFGSVNDQPSAAVIVVSSGGGSGNFYDLALVQEQDGEPVNVATTFLGDRVQINSLDVEDNRVIVDMVTQGPGDALCCPTQQVFQIYELQEGELAMTTSALIGFVESTDEQIAARGIEAPAAPVAAALATTSAKARPLASAEVASDSITLELNELADSYHWRVESENLTESGATPDADVVPAHIFISFDGETPAQARNESGRWIGIYPIDVYRDLLLGAGDESVVQAVETLGTLLTEQPADLQAPLPVLPQAG